MKVVSVTALFSAQGPRLSTLRIGSLPSATNIGLQLAPDAHEPNVPRVWFLLDELATLQRLPQLHTAVTETRWRKGLKDCQIYPREAFRGGAFIETARCLRRKTPSTLAVIDGSIFANVVPSGRL